MYARIFPSLDCAIGLLTWYEAARYCNWLSEQEGIPEKDWCYPRDCGPNMELPKDHLERLGYRLPTEAEWEYSCKAGSTWTPRPYGLADSRLGHYAWFSGNEGVAMHPVGQKKPNDLGLFDMLGNAYEWCLDARGALAPARKIRSSTGRSPAGSATTLRSPSEEAHLTTPRPIFDRRGISILCHHHDYTR